MLTASAGMSQLASVLGGFLITAIALLFDRKGRESVHTLALFSTAVLILMLASFVFSIMTGTVVPDDGDRRGVCAIAWTQGALSTGMLAAGTTALFGGLGWMLAGHAVSKVSEHDSEDVRCFSFLADLGGWLTFAAAMTTTLVLSETSIDYLHYMFGERPELWVVGLITTSAALIIAVDYRFVYLRTRSLCKSMRDIATPTRLTLPSVKFAAIGILVLAVVGSWLSMSLARLPKGWLTVPNTGAVVLVLVLTFAVPSVICTAVCYSVAGADDR